MGPYYVGHAGPERGHGPTLAARRQNSASGHVTETQVGKHGTKLMLSVELCRAV